MTFHKTGKTETLGVVPATPPTPDVQKPQDTDTLNKYKKESK